MSTPEREGDGLTQLIDRALRDQPAVKAPPRLAARVMAEVGRRAAMPWWRRSFAHWPAAMQLGFVAACTAAIGASLSLTLWSNLAQIAGRALAPVNGILTSIQGTAGSIVLVGRLLRHAGDAVLGGVAPWSFYWSALGIGALYLAFAGLVAATYRSLYIER